MTFPWHLLIGSISLPLHVIFETAGIFIGFRYFLYLRNKKADNISTHNRIWILIGAIFGAVIGSRIIGGLENLHSMVDSKNLFFHFYKNTTIVGGLLGGLAGVEITKKLIGEEKNSGDLFTFPLILAMIIGRIGCFSMGVYEDTYGLPTRSIAGLDLGDGILRHPVALYEIIFLILLWVELWLMDRLRMFSPGGKFKLFMISYLVFRLLLDFIKPHYTFSFGLSTIQVTCIAGLAYYAYFILNPKKIFSAYAGT